MWKFTVILVSGLVLAVAEDPDMDRLNSSVLLPRSIQTSHKDRGGGGQDEDGDKSFLDSPVEWTMSKANLVAEFYTSEPAPQPPSHKTNQGDRSPKSIFSFFGNSKNETVGSGGVHNVKRSNNEKDLGMRGPPPHSPPGNLIASGSNFNGQATLPYHADINRISNNGNGFRFPPGGGGYSTPFRPIVKFPQQNFIQPPGSPESGYPKNLRPPRGPPPQQFYGPPPPSMNRPINGLRPPPASGLGPPSPSQLYLPPHGNQPPSHNAPQPQQRPTVMLTLPNQEPRLPAQSFQQFQQTQYLPPSNPQNNSVFAPSQEYLPQQKPETHQPQFPQSQFRPGSPPPQILDNYRNQAVYPVQAPPTQTENKPLVYVMANASSDSMQTPPPNHPSVHTPPSDSFTNYENESVPPPLPYHSSQQQTTPSSLPIPPPSNPKQFPSAPLNSPPNLNLNELALTEPLSQVLADANVKANSAMDKTIRFVIHKPEDEDIVKNAILEDAQNRYEDVRFVQGPTLKVQRKETVYLPPKRKTVVYILLKEPQIDTDVEVMTPQEEEPAPEVYITYQKSDGAVKTKHYSPKPIQQEDMKKYLDIEDDSAYGSAEESRILPRFSKSTSVSLSTSSKVSRTTASTSSSSLASTEVMDMDSNSNASKANASSSSLLANHRMSLNDSDHVAPIDSVRQLKSSPLLYSSFTSSSGSISNSNNNSSNNASSNDTYANSLINYRSKKGRSSSSPLRGRPVFVPPPSPRRVLRNPVQCPTIT